MFAHKSSLSYTLSLAGETVKIFISKGSDFHRVLLIPLLQRELTDESTRGREQSTQGAYSEDSNSCNLGIDTSSVHLPPRREEYTRLYIIVYTCMLTHSLCILGKALGILSLGLTPIGLRDTDKSPRNKPPNA